VCVCVCVCAVCVCVSHLSLGWVLSAASLSADVASLTGKQAEVRPH
jgi:hypothetical protein